MADNALPSQRRPRGRIAGGAAIVAPGRGRARGRTDGLTDDGEITPKEERVAFPPSFPSSLLPSVRSEGGRGQAGGRTSRHHAALCSLRSLCDPRTVGRTQRARDRAACARSEFTEGKGSANSHSATGYVDNYSLKVSVSMYLCNILSHGNICICRNVSLLRTLNMERGRMRSVRAERLHFRKASRLN